MAIHPGAQIGLIVASVSVVVGGVAWWAVSAISRFFSLNEVQERVLEDDVYFEIGEQQEKTTPSTTSSTEISTSTTTTPQTNTEKTISIKAKSDEQETWTKKEYSWECIIELKTAETQAEVTTEKLKNALPTSASHKGDKERASSKAALVLWCSFFGEKSEFSDKKVVTSVYWPDGLTFDKVLSKIKQKSK